MDAALGAARERLVDLFDAKDDASASIMVGLSGACEVSALVVVARE